jgi:hypothetical protein
MNIQEKTTKGFGSGLAGVLSARSHRKLQLKKHKMSIKSSQKMTKLKLKAQERRHKLSLSAKDVQHKRHAEVMKPHLAQKAVHSANQDRRREEKHKSTEVRAQQKHDQAITHNTSKEVRAQHKHVQAVTHGAAREDRAKEKHSWAKERHDTSMGKTGNMTALHVNREKRASEKHQWAADRHRVHLRKQAMAAIPAHQKLSKDEIKDLEVRKGAEEFANKHHINQSMHHWAKQREQAKHASTTAHHSSTSTNHSASYGTVHHDKGGGTLGSRPKEFTPIDRRKPEIKKPEKTSKPSTTRTSQILARVQSREQERKKSQVNKSNDVNKKVSKPSNVVDKQKDLARKKRADQLKLMKRKMGMR